ncbi:MULTISPECIES: acyl carrier protein [unclassified Amycolatopsis]|uniref:acyl carrier protein n=1 Tax=unclassified Amycolatopsis TaxID=2618356 RepID=UPI001FF3A98E|nr:MULTISPECIES: phosphopantetheine-binding protein [unclassified Amycolatopsis]UOZ04220.1 phosphopantetheine-binding protein [Amycolatopsis sp. WQ 127309]WSJ79708.1 phosphopantetheine-binding protein [Amycolatopsis sp. NBC_01307]WSK76797.1 phosphopantetheine-binding protein [Amycolatopsis sp. NBC_01286]
MSIETTATGEAAVLAQLGGMLRELLEEYGLDDAEITMDTTFHDDLELESVDLVALSGQLREHYGERVNFATFIAERDLDEIIALTVGELVRYIVASLRDRP